VIQSKKDAQVAKIGKSGPKFNIHIEDAFEKVKLVANKTIKRSVATCLGIGITLLNDLPLLEERVMLNYEKCQITLPQGVNFHFGYYCTQKFVILGTQQLKRVNDIDFFVHEDEFGPILK
jgi:hypothetical protein